MVRIATLAVVMTASLLMTRGSIAAELPKATQHALSELKIAPWFLDDIDKELAAPAAWIEGAKKEGNLRITGSWDDNQFKILAKPFNERYPFIKINYMRGDLVARAVRPLMALKEKRYITDIVTGLGGIVNEYMAIDGFDNLKDLPAYDAVAPGYKQKDGLWIGAKLRYWCMSYNTQAVKKEDMPKTWDDLLTAPVMRGGKLGLANEAQLWLLPLIGAKGDSWMNMMVDKLFTEVKPQRRKESVNAMQGLVIAGEINVAIPAADYRVAQYVRKGAPIAWHCPEPVPSAISELAVIKGSPNINAAHLFANWLISKEGQISQFLSDGATPIHKDMQSKEFLAFEEEIHGKPIAFLTPERLETEHKILYDAWNQYWNKAQ